MASVEDYKGFGDSLSDYVRASNSSELTSAFKEGGALHNALKSLKAQEEELNKYQDSLLESFKPGEEGSLTQEQMNQQIEKNDAVRNEIAHLQARLGELSEAVGASKSNWNISRAKSEFVQGVDQGLKVENGFFATFVNAIRNAFSFTNKAKIEETKTNLQSVTTSIQNKTDDRVKIPSKTKVQALDQSKGVETPELSNEQVVGRDSGTIPKPPPPPPNLNQNVGVAKESTGKSSRGDLLEEIRSRRKPDAPELSSEDLGAQKGTIPKPPPPPPNLNQNEEVTKESTGKSSREDLLEEIRSRKKPDAPELSSEDLGAQKGTIPKPPSPPPNLNQNVGVAKESTGKSSRGDLLAEIRSRKKKVKLSKDHMNDVGDRDFVYVKSEEVKVAVDSGNELMSAMREQMGISTEVNPNSALNGKDKEAQMNMLYSAMVDGNDKLVEAFKAHETEVDSGRVDDWDEPIMEPKPTFSSEEIDSIEKAANETQKRLERGEDLPSKKSSVEVESVEVEESTLTKNQSSGKVVEETVEIESSTVSKDSIPDAPPLPTEESVGKKKGDMPPPPPNPSVQKTKKQEVSSPNTSNLLEEIRNRAGKGLKSVKPVEEVSMDVDGFTYVKPKPKKQMTKMELAMAKRRGAIAGGDDLESQLDSMSEQEQLDTLYSAVIDDDQKKISKICNVCDEDVFTPEAVKRVCEAAVKIAATQSSTKKIRIEKAVQKVGKEFDVDVSVGKSQSVGR